MDQETVTAKVTPLICACGRPAAPRTTGRRPSLCARCKAKRKQDRSRVNARKRRGMALDAPYTPRGSGAPQAKDWGVAPDEAEDAEIEDVEALLDTSYPADLIEQRAARPARRQAPNRPARETVPPEGSWWMLVPSGIGFTALAESRRAEMAKGKGAKIASQMEHARREP